MVSIEKVAVYQHEPDQCLAACIATAIRHYAANNDVDFSPSLSDVTSAISPAPHIQPSPPHSDHVEDDMNNKLLDDTPLKFRERIDLDFQKVVDIFRSEDCSVPIVSVHPKYLEAQPGINTDGNSPDRHAILITDIGEKTITIWDPILKQPIRNKDSFQNTFEKAEFIDFWESVIDGRLSTPAPKEGMWTVETQLEEGQQRLNL